MDSFIYSVWFRDTAAHPDDQDREWAACISIQAPTSEQAREWGDMLARERAERSPRDIFVGSSVERETEAAGQDLTALPRIMVGQRPTDDMIGW